MADDGQPAAMLICASIEEDGHGAASTALCKECGAGLWVSSAMTPRVEAGTATPYCTPCGLALGAAAGGFGPIPEEVKQQLREMGGERNVIRAQRMVDLINQGIKEGTIKK